MYRHRLLLTVTDTDSWNEAVAIADAINKLCADNGWTQGTLMTRTVGRFNEMSFEFEYPDLTTFERESNAWIADPTAKDLGRRVDALQTQDPGYSELWEEAVSI